MSKWDKPYLNRTLYVQWDGSILCAGGFNRMKKICSSIIFCLFIFGGVGSPVHADTCLDLIAFGRANVTSVEDEDVRTQILDLLVQAEALCKSGNSEQGISVAQDAIELIK